MVVLVAAIVLVLRAVVVVVVDLDFVLGVDDDDDVGSYSRRSYPVDVAFDADVMLGL